MDFYQKIAAATEDEHIADGLDVPLQTSLRLLRASFYFAEERTVPIPLA